ncbi:Flagellar assembly protein FliH [Marinobacter litoralis]|uniref:Flagellar assembly protein FliH n=1 Tax=Marinobacter litoralis TaxID=187981 RepID=A0A3M2RKS9_9GAMM|nr:flagellar assembly protein FliH [Marinobacter litoralis]RMJ05848.1 Flagellar assembly protein FliH [Marinobacter litoralis]
MKDSDQDDKLIPKENLTAWERWELPLLDEQGNQVAREEDVKPLTAANLQEIREAARADGYQEGRDAGYQEGFAQGRTEGHQEGMAAGETEGREQGLQQATEAIKQENESRMARLDEILGELLLPIERHEAELESALVNLATVLARAVVHRELSIDTSQIRNVVRKALKSLPSTADNVRVFIHPDDFEPVSEVAERLEAKPSIIQDDSLMPGGCRVETRNSLVDYTVEKRFQRAVQNMLEEQMAGEGEPEGSQEGASMGELTDFHRDLLSDTGDSAEAESDHGAQGDNDDLPTG